LGPGLNLFNSLPFSVVPSPSNTLEGWYQWFAEPVWPKKGLKSFLQQTLAHPPLKLAPPSIFLVMSVSESNRDTIISGVDVYDTPPTPYVLIMGSNVTVKEIPATEGGNVSIEEP
jgi:hypothetical protein